MHAVKKYVSLTFAALLFAGVVGTVGAQAYAQSTSHQEDQQVSSAQSVDQPTDQSSSAQATVAAGEVEKSSFNSNDTSSDDNSSASHEEVATVSAQAQADSNASSSIQTQSITNSAGVEDSAQGSIQIQNEVHRITNVSRGDDSDDDSEVEDD